MDFKNKTTSKHWSPDSWFKIVYLFDPGDRRLYFKMFKITTLDGEDIALSTTSEEEEISGYVKFDGCIEFSQPDDHYCGIHHAEQTFIAFKELYEIAEKQFGYKLCGQ